jgi:hypothetical protein
MGTDQRMRRVKRRVGIRSIPKTPLRIRPIANLITDFYSLPFMSQQMTSITLTPYEFWTYVKDDEDCDKILKLLGDRNELVSHFLYFSSLARTIDELDELIKTKRKEVTHVFTELSRLPNFRRLTDPHIRQKHRLHPYRRPSTSSRVTSSLPPSPVLLGDSPSTPIDVDSLVSSPLTSSTHITEPSNPPTRPATPVPPFGTAHRLYHDGVHHFVQNGVYYVRSEISGHVYEEEEYYHLPRPPYQHHLPQLRLPSVPGKTRRGI